MGLLAEYNRRMLGKLEVVQGKARQFDTVVLIPYNDDEPALAVIDPSVRVRGHNSAPMWPQGTCSTRHALDLLHVAQTFSGSAYWYSQ